MKRFFSLRVLALIAFLFCLGLFMFINVGVVTIKNGSIAVIEGVLTVCNERHQIKRLKQSEQQTILFWGGNSDSEGTYDFDVRFADGKLLQRKVGYTTPNIRDFATFQIVDGDIKE